MWKAKLLAAIQAGHSEVSADDIRHDDRCELGKWLLSEASETLRHSPHYEKSVELHRRFHVVASEVLTCALNGRRHEAMSAIAAQGVFTEASSALVNELLAWKKAFSE